MGDKGWRVSLRSWVIGLSLAYVVLVSLLFAAGIWQNREKDVALATATARDLAATYKAYTEQVIDSFDQMLRVVAAFATAGHDLTADDQTGLLMQTRIRNSSLISNIMIMNRDGAIVRWLRDGPPPKVDDRDYFTVHRDNPQIGLYVSPPFSGRAVIGQWFFTLSRRLENAQGEFLGVAVVMFSAEAFSKTYAGGLKIEGASVGLMNNSGTVMARAPYRLESIGRTIPATAQYGGNPPEFFSVREASPIDGRPRIVAQWRLNGLPLSIATTLDEELALAGWKKSIGPAIGVWLLILATASLATYALLRQLRLSERTLEALAISEERLNLALDNTANGLWDWNIADDTTYVSPRWRAIVGLPPDAGDRAGALWSTLLHPEDIEQAQHILIEHLTGRSPNCSGSFRIRTASGNWRWVLASGKVVSRDVKGRAMRMVGTLTDITDMKQAEEDLRQAASVFDNSLEGIVITDAKGVILSVNQAFTDITGYAAIEAIGKTPRILKSDHHDALFYHDMWNRLTTEGRWQGELWNRRKNGEAFLEWQTISAVRDDQGRAVRYVAIFSDVTEIRRKDERIKHQAYHDALTGLPNRSLLQDRLEHALAVAGRDRAQLALLFLDLDRFKVINDSLGHDVGDQLLQEVSRRLESCVRKSDTVARLGGDEFVIIVANFATPAEVAVVAEKIIGRIVEPMNLAGQVLHVSTSIGIATYPLDGEDARALMKNADSAMYQAKSAGRNGYRFFEAGMNTHTAERLRTEADLRRAIEQRQLEVHFQPKMSLRDERPTGVEALVRWRHPERGLILPGDFIPLAEEDGMILPIGEWVLRAACQQAVTWRNLGLPRMRLSVNLSARQFKDTELLKRIQAILAETGLDPTTLEVELTESTVMDDPEEAIRVLTRLRDMGIAVSVDDFGTGYSSLGYLKRLPISTLKIDRTFINDLGADPDDEAIIQTILALSRSLGLETVAEGVETGQQAEYLRRLGCDLAQGYLFAKALPAQEFIAWLRTFAAR